MRLLKASSSIGSKILIALTGLALAVFLIAHLAGNLLFFVGPDAFNHYSHNLTSNPLVYVAEAGLIAVFLLHIVKTVAGVLANRAARPERYAKRAWAKNKNDRSRKSLVVHDDDRDRHDHAAVRGHPPGDLQVRPGTTPRPRASATSTGCSSRSSATRSTWPSIWWPCSSSSPPVAWPDERRTVARRSTHPQWTPRVLLGGRLLSVAIAGGFFVIPIFTFFVARGSR